MTEGGEGQSSLNDALEALLVLQDEDLRADQLAHQKAHLPARASLAAIEHDRKQIQLGAVASRRQRDELIGTQSRLEAEIAELVARIAAIDERLSAGEAASFRDQEAMALEMDSLNRRRRVREDEVLEVMEALEPLEGFFADLDNKEAEFDARAGELRVVLAAEEAELDTQIAALAMRRTFLADGLPPVLLGEYERLRAHLGGIGAARIVRNNCSGCNLALSASEVDQIHRGAPTTLFHCEQCGRILVPS